MPLEQFESMAENIKSMDVGSIETKPTLESIMVDLKMLVATEVPDGRPKSIAMTNIETGFLWLQEAMKPKANDA